MRFAVAELRWEEVMLNGRCIEPSLDELFGDAAMRLLMRRDGVTESDVRALLCILKDARASDQVLAKKQQQSEPLSQS
jgi:hypothetical protein